MMSRNKPAFVFIHGAWHGAATWRRIIPRLQERGYTARALDLPGAGVHARSPATYEKRPLDNAAFAVEPSPNADVSQEERTRSVISLIEEMDGPVVLVGHSLGGLTVSAVAEVVPDRLCALVYLAAFLLPPGMTAAAMIQHGTMGRAVVPSLFRADPAGVGALRIDPRSDDPTYLEQVKTAFYADMSVNDFTQMLASLHCDEPAEVILQPSPVTASGFGQVQRHYIRCLEDRAIPIEGQDFMVAALDGAIGGETQLHTIASSHSPFYSQPDALVDVLADIAR